MKKATKKPIEAQPQLNSAAMPEDKCRYCPDCEGVVETAEKLPYYGRPVTVCGAGFNPAGRCHRFELLCMEAQREFIVRKAEKPVVA